MKCTSNSPSLQRLWQLVTTTTRPPTRQIICVGVPMSRKRFEGRDATPSLSERHTGKSMNGVAVTDLDGLRVDGKDANGKTLYLQKYAGKPQTVMLLEEKRCCNPAAERSPVTTAQRDSLCLIDQMLRLSSGRRFQTLRGRRQVLYLGCHLVMFEATSANDGGIWWNGHPVSSDEYQRLMLMSLDPRDYIPTPQVMRYWFVPAGGADGR